MSNSSQTQSSSLRAATSLARPQEKNASNSQANLFNCPIPGSMNDELMVRSVVTASIKSSGKSREQIADEMSILLGIAVTARMITAFTSESKELHRWPGAWDRAFCHATDDKRLLLCRVQADGLRVITPEEEKLLDLGRQYLRRKQAEKTISAIEQEFEGVQL